MSNNLLTQESAFKSQINPIVLKRVVSDSYCTRSVSVWMKGDTDTVEIMLCSVVPHNQPTVPRQIEKRHSTNTKEVREAVARFLATQFRILSTRLKKGVTTRTKHPATAGAPAIQYVPHARV
jgi:hypothetical protein